MLFLVRPRTQNGFNMYLIRVTADRSLPPNESMFHNLRSQDSSPSRDQS
jgi:hypothetical protein